MLHCYDECSTLLPTFDMVAFQAKANANLAVLVGPFLNRGVPELTLDIKHLEVIDQGLVDLILS